MMLISDLVKQLNKIKGRYGDIYVVGGYLNDYTPPKKLTVINADGYDVLEYGGKRPFGVFIE